MLHYVIADAQELADRTRHDVYVVAVDGDYELLYYFQVKQQRLESSIVKTVTPR